VYSCCPLDYEYDTTRIYADGSYIREEGFHEATKAGTIRKVTHKEEKRLEPSELAEVLGWANEPDFVNANPEYVVRIVFENPDWIAITSRDQGREKVIKVFNFSRGTAAQKAKVPPSFLKLARWAAPYSELFK